ncbi:MAG: TRAP transporter substrate-binding protein DctP [Pseudomonadota bacterium]
MRKPGPVVIAALVTGVLLLGLTAPGVAPAEPEKLRAVAFLPENNDLVTGFKMFIDMVNKKFKDSVKIELLGGPEVTPPFQLHEAVKNGTIDMCLTSCGYYPSLVWEAQSAMFSNKDYKDVAATEYHDIMTKLHEKAGLVWLGQGTFEMYFYFYANPEIKSVQDLKAKKIRIFPPVIPLVKALGAVPVTLPMGDIYTAMERGTVDGFVMVPIGFVKDFSWNEVTKQVLDYPVYQATAVILANKNKWDKLPEDVRKAIIAFKRETVDPAIAEYYKKLNAESWDALMKSGVKPVKFPGSEGADFQAKAYEEAWSNISKKSPELGPKLKQMLVK